MHGDNTDAALCHHINRDGAVYAAGQQGDHAASRANGQTARARLRRAVDIRREVADLHIYQKLRRVHIGPKMREPVMQQPPDILRQLDRPHGEPFIRAP
jgi:hypothetical protein